MTLCVRSCLRVENRVSYKPEDPSPPQEEDDSTPPVVESEKKKREEKGKEGMSPTDAQAQNIRYREDVYETDSDVSFASSKLPTTGQKTSNSNKSLLSNVLESKGYYLGKELGRGSFAVVHSAIKAKDQEPCAVKIVDCSKAPEDFITHFFPRELKIIRELQHDNIISVSDIIKVNWYTCIVMERAGKGDILDYLVENGPMTDDVSKNIFKKICLGLQYCHQKEIAHRDLKCENILLTEDNNVKLADFGFARYVVNKNKMRVLSQTYCGSAAYAAPEVLQGKPYNPLMSDIWSLGIILYVMINAVMPFDDASHKKMVDAQRTRKWAFHPERRAHISPNCRRVVRGLLEPDITRRTPLRTVLVSSWIAAPSAQNFLEDLAKVAKEGKTLS